MRKGSHSDLLELGGMMSRGYSSLVAGAGKVIAVITLVIAVLVTFTDMAFSGFGSRSFTSTLIVMLLASYMMYFSLEDSGEREGEESEEFITSNKRYLDVRSRITPDLIDPLRAFCLEYSTRELEYRRLAYLSERGYSKSDFSSYLEGERCPLRARRAFRHAANMKAIKLTPALLMSRSHSGSKTEISNPIKRKILGALNSLIPSTICMIFTVSVILTVKENMSVESVIEGLLKLCALPIVGLRGMLDGYRFAKEDKSAWLETKARLLESFIGE